MPPQVEITVPSTQLSSGPGKAYTQYNVTLKLPLRTFTLQKRYSDFTALHTALTNAASSSPPTSPPPKTYFSSTTNNPTLTESRRRDLESYLQTINSHADPRWRSTPAWRAFLNLPSSLFSHSSTASNLRTPGSSGQQGAITDPTAWLETHRELRNLLHEARLHLTKRDQATSTQAQHEAGASAKKALVRAGSLISALAEGVRGNSEWGTEKLGEGEVRRRRDLVAAARKEKESLENLLNAMVAKERVDATVADKSALLSANGPASAANGSSIGKAAAHRGVGNGRVLGKETARTRELDNVQVVQLQKQMMEEQDADVRVLAEAVRRQRELGEMIQGELVVQNEMLGMLDEDVTRVAGKVDVARKRVDKIR